MPNGISCAFFAGKNLIYGKKEGNIFKEGIAGAQTVRTIDSAAQVGIVKAPLSVTGKLAAVAKRLVYPFIILSGVYNTVKSDDKVKTGASQAGGIASMYTFEQLAEKGLCSLNKKLASLDGFNNKAAKTGFYIAKGAAFIAASIAGYNLGSKLSDKIVDNVRFKKQSNLAADNHYIELDNNENINDIEYDDPFKEISLQ